MKSYERDPEREPVPHERVAAIVGSIKQLADTPEVVTRSHQSREIMQHMGGKNPTMSLQTCIHGAAEAFMREHLHPLSGLSATQLIGMGVRQDRPGRSTLANLIQRQISGPWPRSAPSDLAGHLSGWSAADDKLI